MYDVKVFSNKEFGTIRTVTINGKVLFCGKDVAIALGYRNTKKVILDHCKAKGVMFCEILTKGGYSKS